LHKTILFSCTGIINFIWLRSNYLITISCNSTNSWFIYLATATINMQSIVSISWPHRCPVARRFEAGPIQFQKQSYFLKDSDGEERRRGGDEACEVQKQGELRAQDSIFQLGSSVPGWVPHAPFNFCHFGPLIILSRWVPHVIAL
jgi:hypothetical protein